MNLPHFSFKSGRSTACILVVVVFFILYELQLFNWQIINGDTFQQEALAHRTDAVEISAARGEIWDQEGNVLVGNHVVYEVVYNALYMDDSQRNPTILEVIDLLEERGEKWRDILPIELDENGNYRFKEGQEDEIEDLKGRDMLNLANYATADDCMRELAKRYHYEGFSKEDTRTVVSVRYSMTKDAFSINDPYVIASGVSSETVGVFGEYASRWKGIETRVGVQRYYGDQGALAPHLVGFTSGVTAEIKEGLEESQLYDSENNIAGYKANDVIGMAGAESAFEDELRGKRGMMSVFTDENGEVTTTATAIQPQEGHTVRLTLDSDLQRVANRSLEKNIQANKNTGGKDDRRAHDCKAGAAVAIDISNFGVLAASTYPTYDIQRYYSDFDYRDEMNNDNENAPLVNRALEGIYTPGSVFKPLVAIAGLQEGETTAGAGLYNCEGPNGFGVYKLADLELACTGYHGYANLYTAIAESCNCYFCELGTRLTIRRLGPYAEHFGLGQKTGVELFESRGIMSSPQEYRETHTELGEDWTDGVTAQTAIGQADNMFTPIQLATYCATIATGGRRYRTHFLSEVLDYTGQNLIRRYQPELLYDAEIRDDVLGVVRDAMVQTAVSGTASSVFSDYPVAVACKTGTAETSAASWDQGGTEENISFICYAPADNPKIAVAVMLEHGRSGAYAMNVAKDILDQYFGFYTWDEDGNRYNQDGDLVDDEGEVLKTKKELDQERAAAAATPAPSPDPGASPDPEGSGPEDEPEPSEPTPTPFPPRGSDIPDHIFTGEPSASSPDPDGNNESGPSPDATPEPTSTPPPGGDSPFYHGTASGSPEPPQTPPEEPEE